MSEQLFSPLRSKSPSKPWPDCPDVAVYKCPVCGRVAQDLGMPGLGTERDAPPPCCGVMERVAPTVPEDLPGGISIDYKIVGGFNNNAVQVFWNANDAGQKPAWIMLRTFTGSYLKYVGKDKKAPLVFPLADEDAYVYCDRQECERCVFRCKKGFVIYAWFAGAELTGLVELPMDKTADYFKTGKK